jgi:hypothetical protein
VLHFETCISGFFESVQSNDENQSAESGTTGGLTPRRSPEPERDNGNRRADAAPFA